ncbi:hypothetical protein PtA15_13A279 [Puccinia triticina]|uniref:Uncharacterized protein n=1 Tax=Puccinia triticina TaxID=208348 RepID=A0ABY7D1Z8_9BASI|nr:uncharacterized protein PtA15_13A279 [Puccinia triticina]WAQ90879.1 hypothetical protein PtA15_13A279 [Puccinia triticina]WAR61071.1 hypothetical protein PtB15_13B323 [Puccinia triticina]
MTITIPSHPSPQFTLNPPSPLQPRAHPKAVLSPVLLSEKPRKKDFPSVAKLLDGLSFQDETHPDFILRAARFKAKANPLIHRSSLIDPPTLHVRSSIDASSPISSPLTPTNTLSPSIVAPPSPSIPLILQRTSSDSTTTTTATTSPITPFSPSSTSNGFHAVSSPDHQAPISSRKRPYNPSEQDEEDSDEEKSESESERAAGHPTFGLGIDWQAGLITQSRRPHADPERPLARPSHFWRTKLPLDPPADHRLTEKTHIAAHESQFIGLMASRSLEIRQTDKRRRFVHGARFHPHGIR